MISISPAPRPISSPELFQKSDGAFDSSSDEFEDSSSLAFDHLKNSSPIKNSVRLLRQVAPAKSDQAPVTPQRKTSDRSLLTTTGSSRRGSSSSSSSSSSKARHGKRSVKQRSQRIETTLEPKKTVRFDKLDLEGPTFHLIETRQSIPRRDIAKRWMSGKEFRTTQIIASQHLDVHTPESDEYSARGLERLTDDGMNAFLRVRRDALLAVLQQQSLVPQHVRQRDELIAAAYKQQGAVEAIHRAGRRASLDRHEVEAYVQQGSSMEVVRREQGQTMLDKESSSDGAKSKRKVIKRLLSSFRIQ